jgi:(1->4)-alpha-D-glucan 1-alpha-D-glucosylmutase
MALSELPGEWTSTVARWKLLNASHLVVDGEMRAPSAAMEYMLYQTLLGAWQLTGIDAAFVERIQAYALKAAREGKEQTSWLNPHETYEAGLKRFIERILDPSRSGEFLQSISILARRVALLGALNSLSQLTLKATMPGVPDFYQGTELWDLSLVDPDNRRPIDFSARARLLASLRPPDWRALTGNWTDGHLKLAWTAHLLSVRGELPDVFTKGDYQPLEISGPHHDHVVAFARRRTGKAAVVVVARHFAGFTDGGRAWPRREAFEGAVNLSGYGVDGMKPDTRELPLSELFQYFPAAVLKARLVTTARRARKHVAA